MFVSVCIFKRTRRGTTEYGIAIGADEGDIATIIDRTGQRVNLISDYTVKPAHGCFTAELPVIVPKLHTPTEPQA